MPCGHDASDLVGAVLGEDRVAVVACPSCEETREALVSLRNQLRDSAPPVSPALRAGVARRARAELAAGRTRQRRLFLAGPLGLAAAALLAISLFPSQPQHARMTPLAGMSPPDFAREAGGVQVPPTFKDCGPRVEGPFRVHEWGLIALGVEHLRLGSDLPDFAKRHVEAGGVHIPPTFKPLLYFYLEKPGATGFSPDITVAIPGGKMAYFWPPANCPDASTLFWRHNMLSQATDPAKARPVPKGHWMETARDTDSIWLKVRALDKKGGIVEETERFLFYDGAVPYVSPLRIHQAPHDSLRVVHEGRDLLHDLMWIRNKDGKTRLGRVGQLAPGETATLETKPCEDPAGTLEKLLVAAGLYGKEASGMAKIWEKDLFGRDGAWLVWRLDPGTVDALQPLTIDPRPEEVVRVHLVLTPVPD